MSVHFDFVVSDVDAENIMNIMQTAITRNSVAISKAVIRGDNNMVLSLERDIAYIESLIEQMKTKSCDVDTSEFDYCEDSPDKRHSNHWYCHYACQHCGAK